ncbi:hypothetical protein Tco_0297118, partial [Tanacetum coccineum]
MCLKSWGRNTYARGLIEVSSKKALVDSLVVAIPFQNWSGHFMETIDIGYECQPPRCSVVKSLIILMINVLRKLRLLLRLENRMMGLWSKPVNVNDEASISQPKGNKEASSQPKSNVNGKASTSQPKENKEASLQCNAFSTLEEDNGNPEEDNGNPMDDLIDETRKKVEVPLKKTP